MEEEEEEIQDPLTVDRIEDRALEASLSLRTQTGAILPRLTSRPSQPARRVVLESIGIEVPLGSLFYPCCGRDTQHAQASFGSCVVDFHFADPIHPHRYTRFDVPHVGIVVLGCDNQEQSDVQGRSIYRHKKDGLLTLIDDVQSLSVFYYRGDTGDSSGGLEFGEGGSNQRWLQPVLFHAVLGKLLDGGIIATDGSNCGSGIQDEIVAWNRLCARPANRDPFDYAQRVFRCVGHLEHPRGVLHLWQVSGTT